MKILITICARGGSKGIPGKNIRLLNNIPLIAYTIKAARGFSEKFGADISISTDDELIKKVATQFGVSSEYQRPSELAGDNAGKIDTIKDLLIWQENSFNTIYDYVLDLDVTSPLRTNSDLEIAFNKLQIDSIAINLFSVNHAERNPYFNMVEKKDNGYFNLVKSTGNVLTRQSAPEVFDMNASFYFYRRCFFDLGLKTVFTDKTLIYTMPHKCFDLDHPIDFEFLEYLLANDKLTFDIW